ncbi:MAG TPA: FAD-binding and (Fe-S)-binding domain-containing protein [Thermoanaerobaculia bacterium]|nr:FAD-binding and (Fe-S)-binding domain-containing protein [Thermoanaerobaculia bacterium]
MRNPGSNVPDRSTNAETRADGSPSRALAEALKRSVAGQVRFDAGSRALYSTDASNYRHVPIGVVVPRDRNDVLAALEVCRQHGAPVLARGAGTSLAGQCCNVAVVLDCSKHFRRLLEIDPARRIARVEPGVILDDLRRETEKHGLTFGPDPASHRSCTIGGMIGNNSCGVHSVMAGRTDENVEALEVMTSDGVSLRVGKTSEEELRRFVAEDGRRAEIYRRLLALRDRHAGAIRARFPDIPRRVSGYNLPALLPENGFDLARSLVGSEGTCAFLLEATLRLIASPPGRCLLVLGFEDVYAAADRVPEILERRPIGLEGLDDGLVAAERRAGLFPEILERLPPGRGWLLVEFGGETRSEAAALARAAAASLSAGRGAPSWSVLEDPADQRQLWRVRESALGATSHAPGEPLTWEGWEDSAVAPEKLGRYLRDLRALLTRHGYGGHFYGHFGQGCVHTRTDFDLRSPEGILRYRAFVLEAADLVVAYGGSLSGEHGDGQSRAELLPKMFGDDLVGAFREFKAIWDPDGRMNPGKVVDARRLDSDLRLTARDASKSPPTVFSYASDGGDFSRAVLRCVGVGLCRRENGGTMCPSYRATREEAHTTRGRARLLFEMLRGETITGGWRDESVREALDLCLSCKGCKGECPTAVDMATYKAEFLHHYYRGRLRPRSAYALGLIHRWAPIGASLPGLANFFTQTPGLSSAVKLAAGISPHRQIPRFARQPFRRVFPSPDSPRDRPVLLWPDTFTCSFHPETARSAARVLAAAGFDVLLPPRRLCCGRPLYDHGMLDLAKKLLRKVLRTLRGEIRAGLPVVVLEPSCAAVFQDELPGLFPQDEDARLLSAQTVLFAEFLGREAAGWAPRGGRLGGTALLQGHCHQTALASLEPERALLSRLGLDVRVLDAGCCGMAGAFGFEADHYDVSVAIARDALLPALSAEPEALVVADGFSCREQIRQLAGRSALHVAEVVDRALARSGIGNR